MKIIRTLLASAALALPSSAFAASVLTVTIGDDDCFGTGVTSCDAGSTMLAPTAGFDAAGILPFPTLDNSTALDPAGTDVFGENGPLDFSFSFDAGGMDITSASIDAKVWGLDLFATSPANGGSFGDAFEGARFQLNGTDIGTYFAPPGTGPDLIEIPSFDVIPSLLVDGGVNTISIIPEQDFLQFAGAFFTGEDAFAVDFVRVTFNLDDPVAPPPVVPLPASLPLMVVGLGALGLMRRRHKSA